MRSLFRNLVLFLAAILDFTQKNIFPASKFLGTPSAMVTHILSKVCTKFDASIRRVSIWPYFDDNFLYYTIYFS